MNLQAAIKNVMRGKDLTCNEMQEVMKAIMMGNATSAQIGGFLVGLHMKGETVAEFTAAAKVMRDLDVPVNITGDHIVDTCGTGGDFSSIFNVSTASAFVVAAAGATVAKHGNRSISSGSGSADVLEAAGVNLDITPQQVKSCIESVGIGFMFAQKYHIGMKHTIKPRREMAVRTIFNLLGPLTNPARVKHQLLGVFDKKWVMPMAQVLKELSSQHVLVVHAADGLDEISIGSKSYVAELNDGRITTYTIEPEDFGFKRENINQLVVRDAKQSLTIIKSIFAGKKGPARDIVCLNAGAAIYVANLSISLSDGIEIAKEHIDNGSSQRKLHAFIAKTNDDN
ncbi:MAG: anthranilate phosphoribosyltransferase [Piscirickettsiaceae bacterium]|nr:anthranilate phosphoribosyltransferase [Piscirickettsiaceae bacterium]